MTMSSLVSCIAQLRHPTHLEPAVAPAPAPARTPQPPATTGGGDRAAGDLSPLIPSGMNGQAPDLIAVEPEPMPRPAGAEEDPVVVPDTVDAVSEVGAGGVVPVLPLSTPAEAEDDPIVVVTDTVDAASLEASDVGSVGVVPLSPPREAEGDPLVVADAVDAASSEASEVAAGGVVLTDELRDKIVKQVEYYFSDENLPTDEFMLKFVKKNKDGFVPIGVIASFRKMKKLVQDLSIIEAALRTSSKLVVSSNGKRIRRLHPLPNNELKDVKQRTVVVENLPLNFSMESIQETFGTIGKIMKVTIHDPQSVGESATSKKPGFMLSNKVHALIEYEEVEVAEKAVTALNDERNWRTGLKVRVLAKRSIMGSGKHNQSSKENHETVSKKNECQLSNEENQTISKKNSGADSGEGALDKENMNSDVNNEEARQHQRANTKGGRKGRYRIQGNQIQQNMSGQGHGSTICGSDSVNKPISGPKMPDGTKGFTMGRGRSVPLQKTEKAEE